MFLGSGLLFLATLRDGWRTPASRRALDVAGGIGHAFPGSEG